MTLSQSQLWRSEEALLSLGRTKGLHHRELKLRWRGIWLQTAGLRKPTKQSVWL